MKKLIFILIIVCLVYFAYNTIANGFNSPFLTIPSYKQIKEGNEKIDKGISELNTLIDTNYSDQMGQLSSAKTRFNQEKQLYDSLASEASDTQLEAAMCEEEFLLDYLWILVGNYAEDNNVKFLMETNDEDYTITFNITGSYVSVINFIYDLANDPELRFNISNIVLEGGSNKNTITKAQFTVYGIEVITKTE